ncbi:MAG: hypothetical protein D6797_05350 [Bdellovibrio sp.]|nr:MAG: hypothetical protein D6797_05350 [Bdellovibrio sp.]
MISCKELVKSLNDLESKSFVKRMEIRLHLLMCKHCSAYERHLEIIRKEFSKFFNKKYSEKFEKDLEEKIIKRLEDPKDKH